MFRQRIPSLIVAVLVGLVPLAAATQATAQDRQIAVVTPYLSSVATNEMVTVFRDEAAQKGWDVNVIDTQGDFNALANRLQDVVSSGADAIVLASVDPAQVQDQVTAADDAGIPVFAMDGAKANGVALNVTSDNFALGAALSDFLFERLGGSGNIVKFYHSAHPGVRQRELALDEALAEHPGIKVIAEHYVQVPGPIDDARLAMESIVRANRGEIDGVWAAWDEPAIGALLALQAEGAEEGVQIAGIDGNPQAVDLIRQCTALIGTVRQDFAAMARLAVAELERVFAGQDVSAPELYAPSIIITRDSENVTCG